MGTAIKYLVAFGVGIAGGWAIRSLADSPENAGVKLLEIGIKAKDRVSSWAAVERERLDDMLAEARSNIARENATASRSGDEGHSGRRGARLVKRESEHSESMA